MMWTRMPKEKIVCGLDIGCESVKVAIVKFSPGQNTLLGVLASPVHGFRDSSITDLAEFSECLHQTIDDLAKKVNVKVKDVYLGVSSELVDSRLSGAVIALLDRGRKIIARRDIEKVNQQAKLLGLKMEEEILHEIPQSYLVDDENEAKNPLGLYGRKMAVQSLLLFTKSNQIRNLIQAIHQAGYEVSGQSLGSYAASEMILSHDEKQRGSIVIDLGSQVTSLLVFADGMLRFFSKIPLGGQHLTKKISQDMNIAWESAEEIKKQFASVVASDRLQEEEILFKKEEQYIPLRRSQLSQAIEPDVKDLLVEIHRVITQSNQTSRGIVVIGGGALVPGVIERIGEETRLPVRLGHYHASLKSPALYACAVGLAQLEIMANSHYHNPAYEVNGRWALINHKLKEIYNEYF